MGRRPCCAKEGLNRGAWSSREDKILVNYVKLHGEGKWRDLPQKAGLKRCGKSCRLRWLNYLRPDIKRGNISEDEEELIIRMHGLLGNRWSLIAGRLPGRTDNEIKNYWNTNLSKKAQEQKSGGGGGDNTGKRSSNNELEVKESNVRSHEVIRTKAVRCTRVLIPLLKTGYENNPGGTTAVTSLQSSPSCSSVRPEESHEGSGGLRLPQSPDFLTEFNVDDLLLSYAENPEIHFQSEQDRSDDLDIMLEAVEDDTVDAKGGLESWGTDELFNSNGCFDFNVLSSFLNEDNGSDTK
ncbi:hypothetical protein MLD38_006942 [Melastoma candidum]|uniref:Uncharacterized protein n=1 Tax=Melastoma candidum TaxID=119954 RepID=A0ACB9RTA4_9MYRT|nr:hypothetical protein MLD38_006942 [Melastoma candidum]